MHEFESSAVPILLEPGLEIDELSVSEIAAALVVGAGRPGLHIDERSVSQVFGVRSSFESRLFIDGIPEVEGEQEIAVRQDARVRAELVVLALRVFNSGRVGVSGTLEVRVSAAGDVSPSSGTFGHLFGWHPGQPYVLDDGLANEFREFWSSFASVNSRPALNAALRRFGFALDRASAEDTIVDLMIAAESLFLAEINRNDRGEFRFRIATRAAALLGKTLDERLRISKFMRHAYDARSAIVHGGTPGPDDLRDMDGNRVNASVFTDQLVD